MFSQQIARELGVAPGQVTAAVRLLDEGATVPFIARYRKEATGGLSDDHLRNLEERLDYLRQLQQRRAAIIEKLEAQGALDPRLRQQLNDADSKTRLEDLYLPFREQRRSRAQSAREAGLESLAERLRRGEDPTREGKKRIRSGSAYDSLEAVLAGAEAILIDDLSRQAALLGTLRELWWRRGDVRARVVKGGEASGARFRDYFDYREPLRRIPSHRVLAILRGAGEGVLKITLDPGEEGTYLERLARQLPPRGAARPWLEGVVQRAWRSKLKPALAKTLLTRLREQAEEEATRVFARNLRELLLAAPAGACTTLGLDPGLRSGVKGAVVDATGQLLDHLTLYPHAPRNQWRQGLEQLAGLCRHHGVTLISIGNGTASRETDQWVADLMKAHPELGLQKRVVSEAGASVYSASALAAREFPELDVTLRGAVSIARRLQDPLAELVKVEPRAVGVGQYQHDLDPKRLNLALEKVVEDAVNAVGVELNSASEPLLARVSGLGPVLAGNIVAHRNARGAFRSRAQLLEVPRLGPRAFEQAAGFLRIRDGDEALDGSAVHPEAYALVRSIAARHRRPLAGLIGDGEFLRGLKAADYVQGPFGEFTVADILRELEKPGRDPRPAFASVRFREDVTSLEQLQPGMKLQGVVTNVANFGAFVDVGVHQDGLVHISKLAPGFVRDPHALVKAGQVVTVEVLEVDLSRRRIALARCDSK